MSRFFGDVKGMAATAATRRGSAKSGVQSHVRGWDLGLKVEAYAVNDGLDGFQVSITGGSNGRHADVWLATVQQSRDGQGFDVHIGERFREPAVT